MFLAFVAIKVMIGIHKETVMCEVNASCIVSVVMPSYNAERYLLDSVDSVLNQSFSDVELLIIDDGSTDKTREILESLKDSRVSVCYHSINRGVSLTRNEGIETAKGKFIIFMDDDDIMPRDRIKNHVEFLESNPSIDAVGGKVFDIDSEGKVTGIWNPVVVNNPRYIRAKLLQCGAFINGAVTYRKKTLIDNNIRFMDNACGLEDYELMVRLSKVGKISGIDVPVLFYRRHETNTEKRVKTEKAMARKEMWRKIYKYAYSQEGFILTDEQYGILLDVFDETRTESPSLELYGRFIMLLSELEKQTIRNNPENKEEVLIWLNQCRRWYC